MAEVGTETEMLKNSNFVQLRFDGKKDELCEYTGGKAIAQTFEWFDDNFKVIFNNSFLLYLLIISTVSTFKVIINNSTKWTVNDFLGRIISQGQLSISIPIF